MSADSSSLARVHELINVIEEGITEQKLTPEFLSDAQHQLDMYDAEFRDTPNFKDLYVPMLEVQTLIYGENDREDDALNYLKEAVRAAGGMSGLHSRLLKFYIAEHLAAKREQNHAASVHSRTQAAPAREAVVTAKAESVEHVDVETEEVREAIAEAQIEEAQEAEQAREANHARRHHSRFSPVNKLRFSLATAAALLVLGGIGFAFHTPQVSALTNIVTKHGQITLAKEQYDSLSQQYEDCSNKLNTEHGSIDSNDVDAVSAYNQDVKACQSVLQAQHQAAGAYDALIGKS